MPTPLAAVPRAERAGRGGGGGDATRKTGETVALLVFPATAQGTRHALCDLRVAMAVAGYPAGMASRVESALAEVLNNIVEHACAVGRDPCVRLAAVRYGDALRVRVRDRGRPMPGGRPPPGDLPDAGVPRGRLPEGGFGWFLIRAQSDSLRYRREGGENLLELQFSPRMPD